jgi:hypothetical protein
LGFAPPALVEARDIGNRSELVEHQVGDRQWLRGS